MKKYINSIIIILLFILMMLSLFTVKEYLSLRKQSDKILAEETKDLKLISKYTLIKKLEDENKLMVLSGETEIQATYSNKIISDEDIQFKWLKEWIAEAKSKDLKVNALYTYQFHYDLSDFNLEVVGDTTHIYLSRNRLDCQVELLENKSLYTDRVGLLEGDFTPQEVNSINARTKDLVLNKIQSDKGLRDKAMENVKDNIEKLLGVKCMFSVTDLDVSEYNDGIILKIN